MPLPPNLKTAIFVGGPSGSGKTTLVKALAHLGVAYEEDGGKNPHIGRYRDTGEIDAVANQWWFLDRIAQFLGSAASSLAVVDQHPFGISIAYARLFHERGLIPETELSRLHARALEIYSSLSAANVQCLTIALTASSRVLWERLNSRLQGPRIPERDIYRVNVLFQELVLMAPSMAMNTEVLTLQQEVEAVLQWTREISGSSRPDNLNGGVK